MLVLSSLSLYCAPMIELGKPQPLTATCARGLEKVLADELHDLGVTAVAPDRGAVMFAGDLRTVYDVNLRLRSAMRVLAPLVRGAVNTREDLYDLAASVAWEDIVADNQTFAVEVVGKHRRFHRTTFAGQVVKDPDGYTIEFIER
jgi:23S rRNA G2445 N2-methylase RlmL